MPEVRLVGKGRVKDYDAALDVFNQVSKVAAAVDGDEVWEALADADSGLFMLIEKFASEEAFAEYEEAETSSGLRAAVGEVLEFEQLILLSPISDEQLNQSLESMGAIRVVPVASI